MARTAVDLGGTVLNYARVGGLTREGGFVRGARVEDLESGREIEVRARVVVNATGAFSDAIRRMDDPEAPGIIAPSQGVHIVLDRSFLPGDSAIMVPRTEDGRVLFAIPWHDRTLVGTTDTAIAEPSLEPRPQAEELDFLLEHAALYLEKDPTPGDVLSAFAGVRPLVRGEGESTAALSRDHTVLISRTGLVTVAGGKWTTYRKMAEDAVDQAATVGQLEERPCPTRQLRIHGYHTDTARFGMLALYGSDAPELEDLLRREESYREPLHPRLPALAGEVVWAVEREMARRVEDFLARRSRALILDARASVEAAPRVAALMAAALGRDEAWQREQVASYAELAAGYLPG
jgi:glycerol-3-phosphate dehydrogenase